MVVSYFYLLRYPPIIPIALSVIIMRMMLARTYLMIGGMIAGTARHFWRNAYENIRVSIRVIQGSPAEIEPGIRHVIKFTRQLEINKIVPSLESIRA